MARKLDPAIRAAIIADIEAGNQSCRRIARDYNVAHGTVSKIAAEEGLSFTRREQTAAATEAKKFDARQWRVEAIERFYRDEARMAAKMWKPFPIVTATAGGAQIVVLKEMPPRDQAQLMAARDRALERAAKLEAHDSGESPIVAQTMVNDLARVFSLAWAQEQTETAEAVRPNLPGVP